MKIATAIDTQIWYSIAKTLAKQGWSVTFKYDNFDAGIDSDFIVLEKENEVILMGWDNWFEGEIKCSDQLMNDVQKQFNTEFKFGEPTNLKQGVIDLHMKWKKEGVMNNPNLLLGN